MDSFHRRGRMLSVYLIVGCILWLCSPADAAFSKDTIFEQSADTLWEVVGRPHEIALDPDLGRPVLTAAPPSWGMVARRKTPDTGPREVRVFVRIRPTHVGNASATLHVAAPDHDKPGIALSVAITRAAEAVATHFSVYGEQKNRLISAMTWYTQRAFTQAQPGWPEAYRARIEHDMAELPTRNEKWFELRIEIWPGYARAWIDDRLVGHLRDPAIDPEGYTRIGLGPDCQFFGYRVRALPPYDGAYLPIRLDGYNNGLTLLRTRWRKRPLTVDPASLPAIDEPVEIEGIPFRFSGVNLEGHDHLDLSRSLLRQANSTGYLQSHRGRFTGSVLRDPARIQLRIPNGQYDRLYLIAAADGRPDHLPLVSAMFYRPSAGYAETFSRDDVPLATAESSQAVPLPVTLSNGRDVNLWLIEIPLDPGMLSSFADMDIVELELTKGVYLYRSYPDPISYGWHQGGLPSSVHVYAATLGRVPVGFTFEPDAFGHVWMEPDVPSYTVTVGNHTAVAQRGRLDVVTISYDRTETNRIERAVNVPAGRGVEIGFPVPVSLYGYHDIKATLDIADQTWTETRSLVKLAPDTRSERWTEGQGTLFGYWSYHGGHYTPPRDEHIRLMTMAGARVTSHAGSYADNELVAKHWAPPQASAWTVRWQGWATEDPVDPEKVLHFQSNLVARFRAIQEGLGEWAHDHIYFFPEPSISLRLTAGNYPEYWSDPPYEYTEEEKRRIRAFYIVAEAGAKAIREAFPDIKILIPWGDPLFVVPLLREGFPPELIDGSGLDICGFERLPEQQLHQISIHRIYQLRQEFAKIGIDDPFIPYNEGIFVPTEPGAVSWRDQMDIYHRWTLISMAYGVDRIYSGWFAFDCGDYYGAEHYGGCGIQRRIPYCDPKPAYAAYATMTDRLNEANFEDWLPTGSLTTYALRFRGPRGPVHTFWTIRGKRPVTLILPEDGEVRITDSMNNTRVLQSENRRLTVMTDPSVIYVHGSEIETVEVGEPDHGDAAPASVAGLERERDSGCWTHRDDMTLPAVAHPIGTLGDGQWRYTDEDDLLYQYGHQCISRARGKFSARIETDADHGRVLVSTLEPQDRPRELMPWYNVLRPRRPIELPGAPSHIGLWVKGNSDWGRVIYSLRDANGVRWVSIGARDQWNCDDIHSWSSFNFDGWRYLRFELPGHLGYDNFRLHGTTWWMSDGGRVFDSEAAIYGLPSGPDADVVALPLSLEKIIVEQRTHIMYVNDPQPVATNTVAFGKLYLEYESPWHATREPVRRNRMRMPMPEGVPDLPNPIARLRDEGVGAPTRITRMDPPDHLYDGTRMHIHFEEVEGAQQYAIWVSAHADGRGAVNMTPRGASSGGLVTGLRPAVRLHYWVVYQDEENQWSKPSPTFSIVLKDEFKEK